MTNTRNRRIDHYMHTVSHRIIDLLVKEEISVLVIGKNGGWKQGAHLGERTNQNFVQISHARFIAMLQYKAELVDIRVVLTEESYTSKASLLDLDPLPMWKPDDETLSTRFVANGSRWDSTGPQTGKRSMPTSTVLTT